MIPGNSHRINYCFSNSVEMFPGTSSQNQRLFHQVCRELSRELPTQLRKDIETNSSGSFASQRRSFQIRSSIMWRHSRENCPQKWWNIHWFCGKFPGSCLYIINEIVCFCSGESLSRPNGAASKCFLSILWRHSQEIPLHNWWTHRWFCGEVPGELLHIVHEIFVDSVGNFLGACFL